jgi:hypothetical protein
MSKKVIYMKSLFSKHKNDKRIAKIIDDAIFNANGIPSVDLRSPKNPVKHTARAFILGNTDDFLNYAVSYSLADSYEDFLQE